MEAFSFVEETGPTPPNIPLAPAAACFTQTRLRCGGSGSTSPGAAGAGRHRGCRGLESSLGLRAAARWHLETQGSHSACEQAWAEREAGICHTLRSGRGNVKEEEPDQKRGFFCLFPSQISCSEGTLVAVRISDRVRWRIAVLEVTQLLIK